METETQVTRLEVFVDNHWEINNCWGDVLYTLQDDGKTLKVWVDTSNRETYIQEYWRNFGKWSDEQRNKRIIARTERAKTEQEKSDRED